MTAYNPIPNTDVDVDSPITEELMTWMRDNPIAGFEGDSTALAEDVGLWIDYNGQTAILTDETDQTLALVPDGAGGAEWAAVSPGSGSVDQSSLDTSTGTVDSTTASPARKTLPGGQYAFYPESRAVIGGSGSLSATIVAGTTGTNLTTTFRTNIYLSGDTSPTENIRMRSRFINASPPFDLGDGEIPLFVFVELDSIGNVIGSYVAPVPPWAYNGPTRLRPDVLRRDRRGRIMNKTLKMNRFELKVEKFNRMIAKGIEIPTEDDIRLFSQSQRREYLDEKILVPVDQARKNRDMDIIPTHTDQVEGITVAMLDPPDTAELLELHESGVDIADLLISGYIKPSNTSLNRKTPPGIEAVSFRWKNSV